MHKITTKNNYKKRFELQSFYENNGHKFSQNIIKKTENWSKGYSALHQ